MALVNYIRGPKQQRTERNPKLTE